MEGEKAVTVRLVSSDVREKRAVAAARWKPERVRLLLIAEAPPAAPDRYFYFDHVIEQDSLFRYVAAGLLGATPSRAEKQAALTRLQQLGVFLIDVSPDPVGPVRDLASLVPHLLDRVRALRPDRIILIKTNVFDEVYDPLRSAGLPVSPHRLPFPGSGQQRRFAQGFASAIDGADLRLASHDPVGSGDAGRDLGGLHSPSS